MASTVYERGKRDGIDVSKWHRPFTKGETVTASTFRNGIDRLRKGNCDGIDVSKWHRPCDGMRARPKRVPHR